MPDPPPTQRLFLAIPLPDALREALSALQDASIANARWTRTEQRHLTLRFLGDTESEQTERLVRRLERIDVAAFSLPIEGVGVFPPCGHPKVLWVGVGAGHPRLFQLRQRIDDAILAEGIEADLRAFVPHITLARVEAAKPSAVEAYRKRRHPYRGPLFKADRFVLYESRLQPSGPVHLPIATFPLR